MNLKLLDPSWRLENLYFIIDKSGNKVLFRPNLIQRKINQDDSKRKMILKARQFGVSTNCLLALLDYTIFNRNVYSCILAHERDSIEKLFRIVRRAYDFLPKNFKPELDRGGGSKYEMYFPELNSRIYCDLESRGDTIHRLHVSECAFMKDSSRLKSTLQAVPIETGRVTIETTPNGMGNHFYDMWTDADQPYSKLFFPWYMFPDYKIDTDQSLDLTEEEIRLKEKARKLFGIQISDNQINFRRLKKSELKSSIADLTKITFEQEYPEDDQSCFLSSGESVLDLFSIKEMIDKSSKPIKDLDYLKIYKHQDRSKTYVVGADTAEGVGGDYSVAVMIEVETKQVVAVLRGHWRPFEFAHKLKELCYHFKSPGKIPPILAVERNNHGHAVLLELSEHITYENLYRHEDEKLGWRTDNLSRSILINTFIDAVENKSIILNDKNILNECLTLVNNKGKIEAADNKHDDCIIATSIALQMLIKCKSLDVYSDIKNKILL